MAVRKDEVNLTLSINAAQGGNTLREMQKEARDLRRLLQRLPVGSEEFDKTAARLKEINKQIADANAKTRAFSTGMGQVAGVSGRVASIMRTVAGVFGGLSLAGLAQSALQYVGNLFSIGTALDGMQEKTRTVFGEAESIVQGFAETNAQALGLARQEYVNLATGIGDLLIPMGFTQETAANISSELVNQAGVLSEWSKGKVNTTQASEILNKALLGERDALNTLGIDIKDSVIQDEIKRKGLDNLTGASRRQAEALITLEQITKQSASANEAFANNQGDATRQSAELRARIAEITQGLAQFFIPIVNAVLRALIPVVDYVTQFASRLVQAYQRADTFRGIVTGVFQAIGGVIRNVAEGIASIGEGFLSLFEGDFDTALQSFKDGFSNLNPLAIGTEVKGQFVAGFNSIKNPEAKIDANSADSEEQGKEFARAYSTGLDAEFERLRQTGEKGSKAVADAAKSALEARLKEVEIGFQKEELVADRALFNRELNEGQHAKRILELKKKMYEDQLAVFQQFNQEESRQALQAQQKLVEIQTQLRREVVQPLQALPTNQPGQVTSQTAPILSAADVAASDDDIAVLRDKFARIVDAENEHELQLAQIRLNRLSNRLELLRNAGLQESAIYKQTLDEKLKAEEDFQQKSLDNQRRTEEFKRELSEAGLNTTKSAIDAAIELLSTDEQARKRNAAAIKTFQVAQVTVSGISEVQKIWEKSAGFGIFQSIIAAIQTAAAVARTTAAISKINSAKFATGGYTGAGYGSTDSTGFRPAGIVHEGEYVVPKWMVQSASVSPVLGWLEGRRLRKFAEGGLVNTSPSLNLSSIPQAADAANANLSVVAELKSLRKDVAGWNRNLRANVVYQDLEDTATEIGQVQDDASI